MQRTKNTSKNKAESLFKEIKAFASRNNMISPPIRKKADGILTADWHLMEDTPICRTDNYWETQWRKIDFISELQKQHNCPVIHAGDLFNFWKPSPMLLSETIKHIPNRFWSIYGNHDLPQHNMELVYKCGQYTLAQGKHLEVLPAMGNWLTGPEYYKDIEIPELFGRTFFVWHVMTYQGKEPWPGCTAPTGKRLLKKYPQYDLIVTGDNHKPFVEEYEGRLLVNPGSIFRLKADQLDHRPRVYLWYAETNTVEPVYIPIEDVISIEHLKAVEKRNTRIDSFISTLNGDWSAEFSFEENLERFCEKNKIRQSVKDIIYEVIETKIA